MKTVTLHFREVHFFKGTTLGLVKFINYKLADDEKEEVFVSNGIAYAYIMGNYDGEIYAAIKETPEELAKNPDVKLVYVEDNKKE